jgi:hypothetical protein
MQATAPPVDAAYYYRVKMFNKGDSVEQIANKLGISVEDAQGFETKLAALIPKIISDAKTLNNTLKSDRNMSMGNAPVREHDPTDPLHFGGRKSRRHGKKSRRHAKKSRRHGKKSRRHGKKSRR